MEIKQCLLTGYNITQAETVTDNGKIYIRYDQTAVGMVKMTIPTVMAFLADYNYQRSKRPILAGICRNAFESKQEPPIIDEEFIVEGLKNTPYPKEFKEKARHLLKFIYENGGKEYKSVTYQADKDYPICYANDMDEFGRIMNLLVNKKYWLDCANYIGTEEGPGVYFGLTLTESGVEEVERELPSIPMAGLIQQKISTGDAFTDAQINNALRLFTIEPKKLENMRSACETLAYVLEPLRRELSKSGYFAEKDVSDFFQIVNEFDIRHNNNKTKNIEHPEQLEWVFYSLLNTINTYIKLKARLG